MTVKTDAIVTRPAPAKLISIAALMGAVIFWGSSFVGMRFALREITPMQVIWLRMFVALILILPFLPRLTRLKYRKLDILRIGVMVTFLPCAYYILEANALRFTTSSQAGVISSIVPLLVAFFGWSMLGEKLSARTAFGLAVSVGGVIWLTMGASEDGDASNPVLGNIMEFGAMACAAASMVMLKQLSRRFSSFDLTMFQVIAGCVFFIPGAISLAEGGFDAGILSYLAVIYMGAFVTLGAFGLYNWALSRIDAAEASSFINLVPVAAVVFGWSILGESLNTMQIIAGGVTLAGVWITTMK
ncbi:DMT family transporter [Limisalsivibrio acetivorans]|uniref:DMT family transporter n=1 Tax=Limisalsivibrio acetivorans TaxID=1304888 RepID=UPI0003B2FCC0|nr:DMT family transporter [Limisalsivibrio acetivorans]